MKTPEQAELAALCLGLLEILRAAQPANQNQEVVPVGAGRPAVPRSEPTASTPLTETEQ